MGNMAVDYWLPHRFAALSERLTMQNGVVLMTTAALLLLFYTHGSINALVVMYSINVFLTFSLSEFGMSRFFIKHRKEEVKWKQHLSVHMTGLTLCVSILCMTLQKQANTTAAVITRVTQPPSVNFSSKVMHRMLKQRVNPVIWTLMCCFHFTSS